MTALVTAYNPEKTTTEVLSLSFNSEINKVSTFSMVLTSDAATEVAYLPARLMAFSRIYPNGQIGSVGAGIVEKTTVTIGSPTTVTVEGPGMEHSLLTRTIGKLKYSGDTILQDLLTLLGSAWSPMVPGMTEPSTPALVIGNDETVMQALLSIAKQTGDVFAATTDNVNQNQLIWHKWNQTPPGTGITMIGPSQHSMFINATVRPELIISLKREQNNILPVTRIKLVGGRTGPGLITIAAAEGMVIVPSGFSVDWENGIITDTAKETQYPRFDAVKEFSYITAESDGISDMQDASIALFWVGINWLRADTTPKTNYSVTTTWHRATRPMPALAASLFYHELSNKYSIIINESNLVTLKSSYSMNQQGQWTVNWELGTQNKPRTILKDRDFVIESFQRLSYDLRRLG